LLVAVLECPHDTTVYRYAVLEGVDKTGVTVLVRGNIKINCSLTETCNFVGRTNNKPNEEATKFTNTV